MKLQQRIVTLALVGTTVLATGCSWVKPKAGSESVVLVQPAHVGSCQLLGTTTSQVKDRVGILERRNKKVTSELVSLAKNAAVTLEGDTIVMDGEPTEDTQKFTIYRCKK